MGSKMVLDRKKSADTVVSAGTGYADTMAAGMAAILGAEAEGAVRTLIRMATEKLKSDAETMVQADETHLNETADDSVLLVDRDEKAAAMRSVLVELREGAQAVYGSEFVRKLGFDGDTPSDPTAVQLLGSTVLKNIEGATGAPPAPVRTGMSMDLGAFKAPATDALSALDQALEAATADKRKSDQTLVEKQRSMAQYDLTFSTTANLLSHMLRAAGEKELAAKVRPSTRRPGQTIEDAREPADTVTG